jgi:hypothetical protein
VANKSSEGENKDVTIDVPRESAGDHLHTLARAGLSAVPVIGGPAVELFQMLIVPPLRKRQQEWMESVAVKLLELEEEQQCVVEELRNNDTFIDTMMQATQAAIRTANQDKREALRNAVLNAALPNSLDETHQQLFIGLIETFTGWHLRMLALFENPIKWFTDRGKQPPRWEIAGSLSTVLAAAFPELVSERELYELVGNDLFQRGLIRTAKFQIVMTCDGAMSKNTTQLGEEFLTFITEPTSV